MEADKLSQARSMAFPEETSCRLAGSKAWWRSQGKAVSEEPSHLYCLLCCSPDWLYSSGWRDLWQYCRDSFGILRKGQYRQSQFPSSCGRYVERCRVC
jgi:hypothetical protein